MQAYALRIKQLLDGLNISYVLIFIVITAGSCAFGYYSQSKIQMTDDDILQASKVPVKGDTLKANNGAEHENQQQGDKPKPKKAKGFWGHLHGAIDAAERGCRAVLGDAAVDRCVGCVDYALNKPNPIIQIFYLIIAGGGFVIYVAVGMYKYCPGPYMSIIHCYTGSALMFVCYYSFYKACTTDPGIIRD